MDQFHSGAWISFGAAGSVLARWIRGDTVAQIAASLSVGPDDVRSRLIGAIRWARGRISYDRIAPQP